MYVNGIRTASSSFRGPIQYANTPSFYIGTNMDGRAVGGGGVREFPGIIDEIRITKVALDPSEFHIPPEKSGEATRKRERVSGDAFSVDLLPQQSRIVLDGKVGILNSHSPGSSTPKIKFKGIFGLARNSGGPFEDNSIAVATGDDFFLQVASGLYYEVFVKSATVQGVKLKFSKMLKRK